MTDNNDPIIIFHRTKANTEESLDNQQEFIEFYTKRLPLTTINCVIGDCTKKRELIGLVENRLNKLIVIVQNPISKEGRIHQYGLHILFNFFKVLVKRISI